MIIIGELINGTRKRVKQAIAERDAAYVAQLAARQTEAGASFIDVNPGTVGDREVEDMKWLVETVQAATDLPLALDTPNAQAMEVALETYRGQPRPLINSLSLERERLDVMLPIVKAAGANVVALALSDEGMPTRAGQREATGRQLIDLLIDEGGLAGDQIYLDPIITPLSTQSDVVAMITEAISTIRAHNPAGHITAGLSNISFGLPNRRLVNRVFLTLAMQAGMDSAILDPLDIAMMAQICTTEALLGQDEYCMCYLRAHRAGKLET